MRIAIAFLTLIFASPAALPTPPKPSAYIRVAKSQTCYIAGVGFSCKAIIEKLKELKVN
jgi:hypothetical protein